MLVGLLVVLCNSSLVAQDADYHWRFNEGDGSTTAETSHSDETNGYLSENVAWANGWSGDSLLFDNNGCVQVRGDNAPPIIESGEDFTISTWVYVDPSEEGASGEHCVYGYHSSTYLHGGYSMSVYQDRLAFFVGSGTWMTHIPLSAPLDFGEWIHLAVVRQGVTITGYVNGVPGTPQTIDVNAPNFGAQGIKRELIGAGAAANLRFFKGRIDELKIWKSALLDGEIQKLYRDHSVHWTFDSEFAADDSLLDPQLSDETSGAIGVAHVNARSTSMYGGHPGRALELDNHSYVQVGENDDPPIIESGEDFTISAWVYIDELEFENEEDDEPLGSKGVHCIYGYYSSANYKYGGYSMSVYKNRLAFFAGSGTWMTHIQLSAPLDFGEWVHLAVVRQGMTITGYVNGVPSTPQTIDEDAPEFGTQGIKRELIGGAVNGTQRNFNGKIDELRIWKSARSETEIDDAFHDSMVKLTQINFQVNDGQVTDDDVNDQAGSMYANLNDAFDKLGNDGKFILLDGENFPTAGGIKLIKTKLHARNASLIATQNRTNRLDGLLTVGSNCEVKGLTLDGDEHQINGMVITDGVAIENVNVEDCVVQNLSAVNGLMFGIRVYQNQNRPCRNISIRRCEFRDISNSNVGVVRGIWVTGTAATTESVQRITIDDCLFANITTGNGSDGDCIQTQFHRFPAGTDSPAPPEGVHSVEITNCNFHNYSTRAIKLSDGSGLYVADNTICFDPDLLEPNVNVRMGVGISVYCDDSTVERNYINLGHNDLLNSHRARGIDFGSANGNLIRSNTIILSDDTSLDFGNRHSDRLSGFLFRSATTEVKTSLNNTIVENNVRGGFYGLMVLRTDCETNDPNHPNGSNDFHDNVLQGSLIRESYRLSSDTVLFGWNIEKWDATATYDKGDQVVAVIDNQMSKLFEWDSDNASVAGIGPPGGSWNSIGFVDWNKPEE